jgi:hypothetical protein
VETVSLYFAEWKDGLEADGISIGNEDELKIMSAYPAQSAKINTLFQNYGY